jgi:hypothetical protein
VLQQKLFRAALDQLAVIGEPVNRVARWIPTATTRPSRFTIGLPAKPKAAAVKSLASPPADASFLNS